MSQLYQAIGLSVLPSVWPVVYGVLDGAVFKLNKDKKQWSENLVKPKWNPPSWVFGPVWLSLYTSMGYASHLIVRDGVGEQRNLALALYGSQLLLNYSWTPVFFTKHKLGLSTIIICLLTANVAACIWSFYPINKTAAYLFIPYLSWLSLATSINFSIWRRNPPKKD